MAYTFSLQNVLDWRTDKEDEAKLKLLQAKERQSQEEQYLHNLVNENIHLKEKALLERKVSVMRQQDLYKEVLDEKIVKQKLIVERAIADTQKMEKHLLKAHQDKKVMEKLKEKEKEEYLERMNLEEQKVLDEFATITFGRQAFQ